MTLVTQSLRALRDWVTNVKDTFYIIGTAAGPHPYPKMVRDFQSVIGREVREQIMQAEKKLPDLLVACIGGGLLQYMLLVNLVIFFPPALFVL